MKKSAFLRPSWLLALLVVASFIRAQPGGWKVDPKKFQFSMNMVARIETNGAPNNAPNNHVAAFSGNQIRGYAQPIPVGGQALYFLNLYAGMYLGDKLHFLVFVGDEAKVYESSDTVVFLHHNYIGSIQQPVVLHFELSPGPLIYSLAEIDYVESNCSPGFLVDVQASDDQDAEGSGLKYKIVGGPDSSRFQLDTLTGILAWKNFAPDFENPADADQNNTYLVEVRVSDLSGNASVQTITVFVKDDPIPTAKCPTAAIANTGDDGTGDCTTTVAAALSVTIPANCASYPIRYTLEGATTGQGDGQLPPGQLFASGSTTVRYTVTDESGTLSSACSFTVTVTDNEAPMVTCPDNIAVSTAPDACTAVPSGTAVSVADNCLPLPIGFTLTGATIGTGTGQLPANQVFAPGITTVTYRVTDGSSPAPYTCSFTVTVTDNQAPSLNCPTNISRVLFSGCSATQTGTGPTVSDNCSGFVLNYALSGATTKNGTGQVPGGQVFQAGTTTVLYTATDGDGMGQSTCSFTVTLTETLKPNVTCPANTTIVVGANCQTVLPDYRQEADISDNCTPDSALTVVQQPAASAILNGLGTSTVTVTATDLSGNSRYCTFNVTVLDNPVLQIGCPADRLVCTGEIGDYKSLATLTTGCANSAPTVTQSPLPGTPIAAYNDQVTVTLTATDGFRTANCMFTVAWRDTMPPQALCKTGVFNIPSTGQVSIAAADVNNNSSDNCGVQSLAVSPADFTCLELGQNIVTLTVTDIHGLTATCTTTVTVNDPDAYCCALPSAQCTTNPVIQLDQDGQAQITVAAVDDGSTYGCGLQSVSVSPTATSCSQVGTPLTVTLTVTDLNGKSAQCTATVTVEDLVAPAAVCQNKTVQLDDTGNGSTTAAAVNNGSSDACGIASLALSQTDFTCSHVGPNTVTLTVTDQNNNTATCSATVTVQDLVAPAAVCQNKTVQLDDSGNGSTTAAAVNNGSSDACGIESLALSQTDFTCSHVGPNSVTLTVTDQNNNTATCSATVTVQDLVAPAAVCQNKTVQLDDSGNGSTTAAAVNNGSSDACGIESLALSQTDFTCSHVGPNTVTLTVTDQNNNTATCTATVTVQDLVAPAAVCQNKTVQLDDTGNGSTSAAAVNNGSSDACGIESLALSQTDFTCSHVGPNSVTLTVTDQNNNTATCSATVTVQDLVAPAAVCQNKTVLLDNSGNGSTSAAAVNNGSSDACGIESLALSQTDFTCSHVGPNSVTLTVTDQNNNTASCSATVTVEDNIPPVVTCVLNQNKNTNNGVCTYTVQGTEFQPLAYSDNCPAATISNNFNNTTTLAGAVFPKGTTVVVWTVTDGSNNTATCSFGVTVVDNQPPVITCPGAVTVSCAGNIPAPNPALVVATDNCGTVTKEHLSTSSPYNVTCTNRFSVTRSYRATDGSGNTAMCSQVITVYDNTAPVFTFVPANVTVQCNSVPAVGTPVASDNCGGTVTIAYNGQTTAAGACQDTYTITRQWTATDACGNTKTATHRISVVDTQKPGFISVPANVTVQCNAIPNPAVPTATDNCDTSVTVTYNGQTSTAGACANAYTLTRRWTAADNCGNTRTISQRISVVDNGKPTLTVPADMAIACSDPIPSVGTPTASDGCAGAVTIAYLGQSTVSGACPGSYQIKRTWRATDACGNTTAATQTIQVSDSGAPVFITVPGPVTIECNTPLPPLVNPTASDACGGYVHITFLGNVPTGSGCAADYTVTRTWRAQDLCGNTATTTQVITVQGNNNFGAPEPEGIDRFRAIETRMPRIKYGFIQVNQPEEKPVEIRGSSVASAFQSSTLGIQPNPTNDRFRLDLTDFAGEAVTISIFSDLGQLVWENRISEVADLKVSISLREAGAAAGMYTVSVRSTRGVATTRVVLVE
jgi:hypothetical protein